MRVSPSIPNENKHPKFIFRTRKCNFSKNSIKFTRFCLFMTIFFHQNGHPNQKWVILWIKLKKADCILKSSANKMGKNCPKLKIDGSKTKERSCSVNKSTSYHSRFFMTHIYLGIIPENIPLFGLKLWILLQF